MAAYDAFWLPFPTDFFTSWLTQYPDSYSAHIAAGRHQFNLGIYARGEKPAADTTKEQLDDMRKHFSLAVPHLERSLTLSTRPIASYPQLIQIAGIYGPAVCAVRGSATTPNTSTMNQHEIVFALGKLERHARDGVGLQDRDIRRLRGDVIAMVST